jgi:hypothetical protein
VNNPAQPVTAPGDVDPNRAPRTLSHEQMQQHQADGLATVLSQRERYRMFVRYDNVWWISDHQGLRRDHRPRAEQQTRPMARTARPRGLVDIATPRPTATPHRTQRESVFWETRRGRSSKPPRATKD